MYTRKFKDIAVAFLMVLSLFLMGGGNCLWAFSVDVKNISYANPAPPPDLPRSIVYDFSAGNLVSQNIIIPDNFVLSRPTAETGLTYYFGPYPAGAGETNDITVALNPGSATLTTATNGGCILNTSSPSTAQVYNQWVYAVQLQNFAGMSDTAKKYAVQIGFGSPVPSAHPEFTAAWDGGNLILAPKIYNDAGNGTTVWEPTNPAVIPGLTPATAFVELRISLAAGQTNFNMVFDYRLSPTGNWTPVATYSNIPIPPPSPFPYPGFPALFPYVALDVRAAGGDGTGTHNAGGTYTWDAGSGVITFNWTSSDFICDGPELGTDTQTGVTVTATTMPWANDGMTWTRTSGTAGDILGAWTSTDSETGNAYTLTFNANGTVSVTGVIVQCPPDGGMDPFQVFSSHEQNGYYALVFVNDPEHVYSAVSAASTGLLSTTALAWNGSQWWLPQGTNLLIDTEIPTTFPSFHIVATKAADETQEILDRAITGYVQDFVTVTSPGASVTTPPTFSWTWPAGAPVERFGVGVRDETANMHVMDTYDIQPSQRSIAYNGQTLIPGHQYRYWIQANIGPNGSRVEGTFTYTGGGTETISFSGILKRHSDSSPVSGGVVEMAGNPSLTTTANADGTFALAGLPSGQPFTVKFTKPPSDPTNYVPSYSAVLQSMANFSSARAFNLYTQTELNNWSGATGRGVIMGRVVNNANTQVAFINGAVVTYNSTQGNAYRVKYENDQGLLVDGPGTFTNGKYYILDVAEGDTVTVFASHPNYAFPSGRVFITHDGAVSQGSVYGNANPGWVTIGGLVKTGDNTTGIGGATVEQVGVTPVNATISNSDGSFALTVPSGSAIYLKFSKPQAAAPLAPTYTAEMQFMMNASTIGDFNLFSITKLGTGTENWNVTPGKGIIRARVKDQTGNNLSGATVTYASALNRTDYLICYDDACSSTLTATPADGRYIIKNLEPGDTLTVTAQKAGMTFTQRVFHVYGDSVHQGGITALSTGPTPHPEAEAIQTRFGAAIAAYNAGDFTATGFASFISESYLDSGENKAAFIADAQQHRDPNVPLAWTNLIITGTGNDAILNLTWSDGDNDTLYFRKEGDLWMIYGNQKLFDAEANSGHQMYTTSPYPYWVSLQVEDPVAASGITISSVHVAGFGLPAGGINLYHDTMGQQWHSWGQGPSQTNLSPSFSIPPAVPLDYTFTINYTGGTSVSPEVQTRQVQSFVDAAPIEDSLTPWSGMTVTGPLTFSWGPAGTGYRYSVELNDPNYNRLWEKRDLTGYSVIYDGPALAPGQYSYTIVTSDAFGNNSFVSRTFNYGITSPYYTVNVVKNNIRVIKGQQAEFVLNTQFFNNYSTVQGIGFTTDLPVLNAFFFFTPVPVRHSGGVVMKVDTTNLAAGTYQGSIQYGEVGSAFDKSVPFTLQVVTVTDIKFYEAQWDSNTSTYIKTYFTVYNVANQGQTNFWSANNEITLSDNSVMEGGPLEFTGNDPRFITIHKSSWGNDFFAEGPNGLSTVNAVAPDGTTRQLTFDINIPATPQVTSIGLAPAFVTNKYADAIAFSATGTESIGYGSRGMLDIKDDTRSWYDANRSVSGTFKLDLTNPPAPGKYLFTAFISGATSPAPEKAVPLIIVNDPSYSMIRGGVRLLDPSLPIHGVEGFTLEFYNSLGVKQFSREYWSYPHSGSTAGFEIGAIPPGTYKIKFVPNMYSIGAQWWPNAADINGAQAVEFAAGQVVDNIYFFPQSVPTISFSGSVRDISINSPTTGNPIAGADVSVIGPSYSWAMTDASGNFTLYDIPVGQPFEINVAKDGYIPVYTGNFNFATNIASPWPFALMTESEVSQWQVGGQSLWQSGKGMITSRIVNGANPTETIGGAQISVTSALGNTYNVTYFDGTVFGGSVTAPNGLFYIYGITPGDTVTVTAFKDGWAFNTNTYTVRYESISEQLLFGTSGGTQNISFFGAVTDRNNNPIAAAQVEVVGSEPLLSTISDGMGNFVLSGIPLNQTFHLKISMPGYLPTYTQNYNVQGNVMAGNRPFTLRTADQVYTGWGVTAGKAVIQGQVVDRQDGQDVGIGGASVTAQGQSKSYTVTYMDDAGNRRTDRTYGNGKYFVIDVDPGDAVTVTAKKLSWKFPTKVFVTHADGVSQGGFPGTRTLAGIWAHQNMGREPDLGGFYRWTETGTMTFMENATGMGGTGSIAFTRNENGTVLTDTESFTYSSFTKNADGRYTLMMPQDGTAAPELLIMAISEDGSMIVLDGAMKVGDRRIDMLVRMDPNKTYGNIDLSGDYFGLGYEHNTTAVTPPAGNGAFMAISNITTFNGAGSYTYLGQANSDGSVWTDDKRATARSYSMFLFNENSMQTAPYTADASTVLLDHFDGTTSASIMAYSENSAACGAAKPSATPSSSFVPGAAGYNQALTLISPTGQPAGSATYLKYPGGQLLSQANGTIEFLIYVPSYGTGISLVDQGPFYGSCAGWTFGFGINASGQLQAGAWAAFNMNSGTATVPLNAWTHVAATWGSAGAKLFINGVQVGSDTNTGYPANGYGGSVMTRLGTIAGVDVQIDELRISNVQRTTFNVAPFTNGDIKGAVSFQNGAFLGHLSGNGNVLLGGGSYMAGAADTWANYIFLKKGDRIYSTADLAGSWAFSGYGDSNGSVRAESGTMTCDAAGICNINGNRLLDNGTTATFANTATLSVAADGSFASPGSVVPLGAIGNGGKTLIWNLSFDPNNPQERLIVVAVKVGSMAASTITNKVWSGTHYDGQTYYGDFVVEDPMHALTGVTLAGPGITGSLNLTYRQDAGAWWTVPQLFLGSLPPTDAYYSITLQDGSSNPPTVQQRLSGGVTEVATNLAPTGEQTGKITFTFTGIAGADGYTISLFDGFGNMVWQSNRVLATTIPYEGPPLPTGVFNYVVHSWIGNNCSMARASFTFSLPVQYQAGDVNHDGKLGLADAIIALRVVAGLDTPVVFPDVDVNFDGGIGMAEALFVMQAVAGLRISDQQSAVDGINASFEAYKTLINTKGAAVTPADLLPFFHPAYLDNGMDRNQAAQDDLPDGVLQIDVFQVNRVLFFDDVRKIVTVEGTFSGTVDGNAVMEQFIETLAYDQASGRWLRFGNQKIGEFSAWLGTRKVMSSTGTADYPLLHLHLWAPQNRVNQVIVSGPELTGTAFYKDPYPRVEDGITYDQFTSTLGTELPISRTPAVGDTYTFNVTKSDSTMLTYVQTLQEVILGAPQVSAPTGHALADANLGSQLEVSWTLPDARITMDNVMLQGQVCNASGCSSVDGVLTSPTSGTITLPALTGAISASIDVRVHFREQVFTNCRFEFE